MINYKKQKIFVRVLFLCLLLPQLYISAGAFDLSGKGNVDVYNNSISDREYSTIQNVMNNSYQDEIHNISEEITALEETSADDMSEAERKCGDDKREYTGTEKEYIDDEDKDDELYNDLLCGLSDIIPAEAADQLPDTLLSSLEAEDLISEATSLNGEFFIDASLKNLRSLLPDTLRQAICIIGIIICASVLRAAKDGSVNDSVSLVIDFISCICILLYAYEIISGIWNKVYNALYAIDVFMKALVPMMTAVYACLGGFTSSTINSGGLSLLIALFEEVTSSLLYPVLRVCLGFTVVSSFTDSVDLSGLISFVKKTFISVLSFIMALFTAVMSYQSVLAQSADTLLSRTIKFAAGSIIPIIGGALSEATGSVIGSVSLIKSTMGTISTAVILLLALDPIISIILSKIGFGLASMVSKALGCVKESRLLDDINGILDFALALTAVCIVMFIFALSIFTKMSVA